MSTSIDSGHVAAYEADWVDGYDELKEAAGVDILLADQVSRGKMTTTQNR